MKAALSNPEDKTICIFWNIVLQIWHKHIHLVKTQRYSFISKTILLYIVVIKFSKSKMVKVQMFSFQYLETSQGSEMDTAHASSVTLSHLLLSQAFDFTFHFQTTTCMYLGATRRSLKGLQLELHNAFCNPIRIQGVGKAKFNTLQIRSGLGRMCTGWTWPTSHGNSW